MSKENSVNALRFGCTGTNDALTMFPWEDYLDYLFSCAVSTGTHAFTIRNHDNKWIAYFSADGRSCGPVSNGGFSPEFPVSPFYRNYSSFITNASLITITDAPCNANPCCFLVLCYDPISCALNLDYSWTASPASVINIGTIVGAVVGVLVLLFTGYGIGYCRYRQKCCFKPKYDSITV